MSAFGGKADIDRNRAMSANDPKGTFWSAMLICQERWQAQLLIEAGRDGTLRDSVLAPAVVF